MTFEEFLREKEKLNPDTIELSSDWIHFATEWHAQEMKPVSVEEIEYIIEEKQGYTSNKEPYIDNTDKKELATAIYAKIYGEKKEVSHEKS